MDICAQTTICQFGKRGRWPLEENAWINKLWKGRTLSFMKWWNKENILYSSTVLYSIICHIWKTLSCAAFLFLKIPCYFRSWFFFFFFLRALFPQLIQAFVFLQAFSSLIVLSKLTFRKTFWKKWTDSFSVSVHHRSYFFETLSSLTGSNPSVSRRL